ncbi:MAG: VCBS repeat-containing protein, partial [Thermoanaerobaculia bacterium]|nr:VCBS repeat-containing protein [Thermoanaerobaculia bacterium]
MSMPHALLPVSRAARTAGTVTALVLTVGLAALVPAAGQEGEPSTLNVPEVDVGENMLAVRQRQQLARIEGLSVRHDFRFEDRQPASGITFQHRFVDDGGKEYKMVHYDHGNGVAAADVDGDGQIDLYFTSQTGANELWRNLGEGRFENVTERAGVAVADRISMAASFADIDNDGDADLYVTTVKMGNLLFENDGSGRFEDVSERAGVGYVGHSSAATFFDYDRDGFLDLYLTNVGVFTTDEMGDGYWIGMEDAFQGHLKPERAEHSILYRNRGDGTFDDVSAQTGLVDPGWNGDAAFADVDRNGWLDLYVLNMQGDDHLWLNTGGRFSEATERYFPRTPWGAMGIAFFDYDNNGWLDLILTDMHSDMGMEVEPPIEKRKSINTWSEEFLQGSGDNIFGNAFYRNLGEGRFEEVSDALGTENYWPWGLSVGDLNADGWEDVLITASMSFPFRYGVNTLLLNDRGERFADAEFALGIEPRR